jgi:hypothetical protein
MCDAYVIYFSNRMNKADHVYVVTSHVFLFVGTGLWGQAIVLCCCVMYSRVYLMIFL